jgi:hypothetical protein
MWHKAQAQPSQSGAGRPGVGAFSNSTLPTCQGRSGHEVSNVQSRCSHETWPPSLISAPPPPPEPTFGQSTDLTPPINTPVLLPVESVKKVKFSFV